MDFRWKFLHAFASPDFSIGTEDYYTTSLKNWSGKNYTERSIFTAQEYYSDVTFWRLNAGGGRKLFNTGAVPEITPLDTNPVDLLNLESPREMANRLYWGQFKYGIFSAMYVHAALAEGKLPLDPDNSWSPDISDVLDPTSDTHGGGSKIDWGRIRFEKNSFRWDFIYWNGKSPFQNIQVNGSEYEPDYYTREMYSSILSFNIFSLDFNFGGAYIERKEWLDNNAVFEGSLEKILRLGPGNLKLTLSTIQSHTTDKGYNNGSNRTTLWRDLSPENLYLDSSKLGLNYQFGPYELESLLYVSNNGGVKNNSFLRREIFKSAFVEIGAVLNSNFYKEYENNSYVSIAIFKRFSSLK